MPAITPDLRERARGCLLGAAVGDAFGMALDRAPRQPVNAQIRSMRRGRLPEGQFTASTGAMLTVAEALLEASPPDAAALAARVEAARKANAPRIGVQARGLLAHLAGVPPRDQAEAAAAESPKPDAGVLLRCLPLALANLDNPFACLTQARDLCRATHPHPDCAAGGGFVATVLWHLIQGLAPRQALRQSLEACGDLPSTLEHTIRWASTRLRDKLVNGAEVQPLVESAVWGLLTTASFAEAVTRVTNLGGSAAIAGALIGAWAGAAYRHSGIPADWRTLVHGTWPARGRTWREKDLADLALRLALA
ncbi:MAG TPA: ADP-ribosylglycohydrolase family protein [Anaerolineae bacterium]|nr:ADP-ribosylglycohydrolase family protein [Anaerolineae bacterium]HOR00580.1 ADP-ribosylglycohydrolase family protein [Anaerolineae bacterium]HPL30275.1 ADP-ribosylglycohydrolase family protein [Anaerolineae bacterium]